MAPETGRLRTILADRYQFRRELGAGGMATVFLAEDLKHHRPVAVKVLRPELSAVLGADRFLKEIELTANLQHPHLLPLFDSGEADGLLYYVMPFVEGESLREKLARERQLSVEEAVRITTQVGSALDYAHRHGIIHRDIKPENVLLHDGQALIADFGIALALRQAGGERLTQTGLSLGTPQYMSPEQAAGDRVLDSRSDIYSLACVLYEMLTGEPPHSGPTVQAVIAKLMAEPVRPVTILRPTVPPHVVRALEGALAKLPADRFESVAIFNNALLHPEAAPHGGPDPSHQSLRTRRIRSTWQVVVPLLLLSLAAWGWLGRTSPLPPAVVLRLPLTIDNPPRSRSPWTDGARISPDGTRLAYYTSQGWRLLDLKDGTNKPVSKDVAGLMLVFSPEGDSVALSTVSRLQQIYVADVATGRATLLTECCFGLSEWDDQGWIYHNDLGNNLVRTQLDGRRDTIVHADDGRPWGVSHAAAVPGAQAVIYIRPPAHSTDPTLREVVVRDLRSGTERSLMRGIRALVTPSRQLLVVQADGKLLAARFDPGALRLKGDPAVLLDDIEVGTRGAGHEASAALSVANDGTLLYVRRGIVVDDTVLVVDRTGRRVGTPRSWGGWVNQIAISPDGTQWAAAVHPGLRTSNIWTLANNREPRPLTYSDNLDFYPRFIPGTHAVAFVGSTEGKNWDLYRVPFEGGTSPTLILDRDGDITLPRFTADGRWVVFCDRAISGQMDIVAHRLGSDSMTVPLVATPAFECSPDVSPDGRWLAYESNVFGTLEVYVRPFDAAATNRWQISQGNRDESVASSVLLSRRSPRWSTDGRELFYLNEHRQMVAVPVATGPVFSYGQPRVLFTLDNQTDWSGEISPDGQGFVLLWRKREAPGQVMMIRNFHRLIDEKLGR